MWAQAKQAAQKQNPKDLYALTTHIFQQMKKADEEEIVEEQEQKENEKVMSKKARKIEKAMKALERHGGIPEYAVSVLRKAMMDADGGLPMPEGTVGETAVPMVEAERPGAQDENAWYMGNSDMSAKALAEMEVGEHAMDIGGGNDSGMVDHDRPGAGDGSMNGLPNSAMSELKAGEPFSADDVPVEQQMQPGHTRPLEQTQKLGQGGGEGAGDMGEQSLDKSREREARFAYMYDSGMDAYIEKNADQYGYLRAEPTLSWYTPLSETRECTDCKKSVPAFLSLCPNCGGSHGETAHMDGVEVHKSLFKHMRPRSVRDLSFRNGTIDLSEGEE